MFFFFSWRLSALQLSHRCAASVALMHLCKSESQMKILHWHPQGGSLGETVCKLHQVGIWWREGAAWLGFF